MTLAPIAASAESAADTNVIIAGKIENMTERSAKVITAINCNPWNEASSRHAVKIDSSGRFKTSVDIPYGHNFTIYYDRAFFCQYAEPGDSIFLTIDAADLKQSAGYSGAHSDFNNAYGRAYFDLFSSSFIELPSGQMPKDEYTNHFKKIFSGIDSNLNHYADSVDLALEAKEMMRQSLLFALANSALDHEDKTPEDVLSFFEDSIFGLDDERNLREMMFPYHLHEYLNRLEKVVKPDSTMQMIDAITSRHTKSRNRDIMLGICLHGGNERVPAALFADQRLYDRLYAESAAEEPLTDVSLPSGAMLQYKDGEFTECSHSSLKEMLEKEYKGKVIYLDLWATWCGPCIESNKSLPEVADFFKDKDIVFVSIALKSGLDRWKDLVRGSHGNRVEYFINSDDDTETIMSSFGMSGFPTYRIINANSAIIDANPPRPNSPAIYDTLLDILHNAAK